MEVDFTAYQSNEVVIAAGEHMHIYGGKSI